MLILDEVSSVGDGTFRIQSETKIKEIISAGVTMILVTLSLQQVCDLCDRTLGLLRVMQIEFGEDVQGICNRYQEFWVKVKTVGRDYGET